MGMSYKKALAIAGMSTSQRAVAAAKESFGFSGETTSVAEASRIYGVSKRTVERARALLSLGRDDLLKKVESGDKTISIAYEERNSPVLPEDYENILIELLAKTGMTFEELVSFVETTCSE